MKLTAARLVLPFLASWNATVVWGDERHDLFGLSRAPLHLFPVGNESLSGDEESPDNDQCLKYQCGSYSLATPIERSVAWKAFFANLNETETTTNRMSDVWFLWAGVSCSFQSDRTIFDNDYDPCNNKNDGIVQGGDGRISVACNDTLANSTNITNLPLPNIYEQMGESKEDYVGISLTVPKDIQIRIYAIDDDLDFRYRSNPCKIITPLFEVFPALQFNNRSYNEVPVLRFVWNREIIKAKYSTWNWKSSFWLSDEEDFKEATLELWIPNRILETTTILGPKYDYSLVIEINGDLVDTGSPLAASANIENENESEINITTTLIQNINATANETDASSDVNFRKLLTKGPPRKLTVWNSGVGTTTIVDIDTSSIGNTNNINGYKNNKNFNTTNDLLENIHQNPKTELNFIDRSLNGEVKIRTDSNVHGLIQLAGSNTRAAMVRDDPKNETNNPFEDFAFHPPIEIRANGFQQVLTIKGDYDTILLEGTSIALYTTGRCPKEKVLLQSGIGTICIHNWTHNESAHSQTIDSIDSLGSVHRNDEIDRTPGDLQPLPPLVELPSSCLAPTHDFEYNCNPLSSGASPSRGLMLSIVAATAVAWSVTV